MIDRPLIFGSDIPSIMVYREQIKLFRNFLTLRNIRFQAISFLENYEILRFPSMTNQDVDDLLDQLAREPQGQPA